MSTIFQSEIKEKALERLAKLKPEQKPLWGKMNAVEMVSHVNDTLKAPLGDIKPEPLGNFFMHTLGKFMVLNLPFPKSAPTHPEYNKHTKGRKPDAFDIEKQNFALLINRVHNSKEGSLAGEHPNVGKMSHDDWGKLMTKHIDHHFRQFGI
jgi:hypothetical protein